MPTVGGETLPEGVTIESPFGAVSVISSINFTLGGTMLVYDLPTDGGGIIDIVSPDDQGWVEFSVLKSILELSKIAGNTITLSGFSGIDAEAEFRFRHEDAPVVTAEPLIVKSNYIATDLFHSILIKLMQVSK